MFSRLAIILACDDSLSTSELEWRSVRTPKANCQWVEVENNADILCDCYEGFTELLESGKWVDCDDINECLDTKRCNGENQVCKNTFGSFICDCIPGFEIESDGSCVDVNECNEGHNCDQICRNTVGSYYCDCHIEFKINGNTR